LVICSIFNHKLTSYKIIGMCKIKYLLILSLEISSLPHGLNAQNIMHITFQIKNENINLLPCFCSSWIAFLCHHHHINKTQIFNSCPSHQKILDYGPNHSWITSFSKPQISSLYKWNIGRPLFGYNPKNIKKNPTTSTKFPWYKHKTHLQFT
jgi:hypothetical protein